MINPLIQYPTQDTGCKAEGDGDTFMWYLIIHTPAVKPVGSFVSVVDSRPKG